MLFSEPKIPQLFVFVVVIFPCVRFSALQRAENSSIKDAEKIYNILSDVSVLFSEPKIPQSVTNFLGRQSTICFSALQRAENSSIAGVGCRRACVVSFSALQRAENSSMPQYAIYWLNIVTFQCSSASRKFLNVCEICYTPYEPEQFQCSSASRKFLNMCIVCLTFLLPLVSVLFSEPKIPQFTN